jgi:hypothetical protein
MKFVGPMAQDVAKVFPDKVYSVGGWLHIDLSDLPPGLTLARLLELIRPPTEAGWDEARATWGRVFAFWNSKRENKA